MDRYDSSADGSTSSDKWPIAAVVGATPYGDSFPLDEPVTLPLRGSSGRFLNGRVLSAMEGPHHAGIHAYSALDELIRLVESLSKTGCPPPP